MGGSISITWTYKEEGEEGSSWDGIYDSASVNANLLLRS